MKIFLDSVKKITSWNISKYLENLAQYFHSQDTQFYLPRIRSLPLKQGDVILDLGANVGEVTTFLASTQATVSAYEPNPYAYAVLQQRFKGSQHVICRPQAVSDRNGRERLYLHENSEKDQVYWSTGSSLLACKKNVDRRKYVEVEVVDILTVLAEIRGRIKLIKMDVEGVEYRILKRLIDSKAIDDIDHIWVETHDQKIPELREEALEVKAKIQEKGLLKIRMDWV